MLLNPLAAFSGLRRHRHLLLELAARQIALRYRGTFLGLLWSFAQPLLMLAVYSFVFGIVFRARWQVLGLESNDAVFPLFLFCGLAIFQMFSDAVNTSASVILANTGLVKKVIFPLELLPMAAVLTAFAYGLVWFVPLFFCACVFLHALSWTMLLLPLPLLALFLLTAGVAYGVAAFGVYIRDMPQLVGVAVQVLFFMTPIFYPLQLVPQKYHWLLRANPLTYIVEETRGLFLAARQPDYLGLALALGGCLCVFQLGYYCFARMKKGFADVC